MGATGAVKSSDAAAVAAHTPTRNGWGPPDPVNGRDDQQKCGDDQEQGQAIGLADGAVPHHQDIEPHQQRRGRGIGPAPVASRLSLGQRFSIQARSSSPKAASVADSLECHLEHPVRQPLDIRRPEPSRNSVTSQRPASGLPLATVSVVE
jgi:hypothetical protein